MSAAEAERTKALEKLITAEPDKILEPEKKLHTLQKEIRALAPRLVGTHTAQTQEMSILEQWVKDLGCTIKTLEMQLKGRDDLVEELYDEVKEWHQKFTQEAQAL